MSNKNTVRFTSSAARYHDIWQLPMSGRTDASQVPHDTADCKRAYSKCDVRLAVVPLSDAYTPTTFDPLGLTDDPTNIARLMGVEIQHGRLAMFSMLDYNL